MSRRLPYSRPRGSCASAVIALALLALTPTRAAAQSERVRQLAYDTRIDIAVSSTGLLWLAAAEVLKAELVPEKCRWCYRNADGTSDLNIFDRGVRRSLKWRDERLADKTSSVIAFAVLPAAALGSLGGAAANDDSLQRAPVDGLLTAQATILAADLNQLVKFAFARERPFVHYLPQAPDGLRALTDSPSDDNLSFYSGHTNLAFAIAASSSTIAFMRGYRLAPLVLGIGAAAAVSVGYLRIAADKHYFSDVMVGAVLGSLVGAFVPIVFHPRVDLPQSPGNPSAVPQPLGTMKTPFVFDGVW
jgi:membrane-associated phospholipid phosphatase